MADELLSRPSLFVENVQYRTRIAATVPEVVSNFVEEGGFLGRLPRSSGFGNDSTPTHTIILQINLLLCRALGHVRDVLTSLVDIVISPSLLVFPIRTSRPVFYLESCFLPYERQAER